MTVLGTVLQVMTVIVAATGGVAGLAALLKIGPERRKLAADAFRSGVDSVEVLSRTAVGLNAPYIEQIRFLRTELAAARNEIAALRQELREGRTGDPVRGGHPPALPGGHRHRADPP